VKNEKFSVLKKLKVPLRKLKENSSARVCEKSESENLKKIILKEQKNELKKFKEREIAKILFELKKIFETKKAKKKC
jgi:hypothetical protein